MESASERESDTNSNIPTSSPSQPPPPEITAPSSTPPVYYEIEDAATILVLFGEEMATSPSSESLPTRTLTNFVFHESGHAEVLIPFYDILNDDHDRKNGLVSEQNWKFAASGQARPWFPLDEDAEEEEEEETDALLMSPTIHIVCPFVDNRKLFPTTSPEIWIQTPIAWYLLLDPHPDYKQHYKEVWTRQRILSMICLIVAQDASDEDRKLTSRADLLGALASEAEGKDSSLYHSIIGRQIHEVDLNEHVCNFFSGKSSTKWC